MKKSLILIALACAPMLAAADPEIGVSITIGQPSYYGPIEIVDIAPPPLLYVNPVRIRYGVCAPLYFRVPLFQSQNWALYCDRYNACACPVYFVNESWYLTTYVPWYSHRYRQFGNDRHFFGNDRHFDNDHRRFQDTHSTVNNTRTVDNRRFNTGGNNTRTVDNRGFNTGGNNSRTVDNRGFNTGGNNSRAVDNRGFNTGAKNSQSGGNRGQGGGEHRGHNERR